MAPDDVATFRSLRGIQGQTTGTRRCQQALQKSIPDFSPPGLAEFLDAEKTQNTTRAREVIAAIEVLVQKTVLDELKREFGSSEQDWFFQGVPKTVRKKVDDRINEEQAKSGGREDNFDLIDYREIVTANWTLFEETLATSKGNKDARTKWLVEVNDLRKRAMHASKGIRMPITSEQLAWLEDHLESLKKRVSGTVDAVNGSAAEHGE
jgi:hypothetical protein